MTADASRKRTGYELTRLCMCADMYVARPHRRYNLNLEVIGRRLQEMGVFYVSPINGVLMVSDDDRGVVTHVHTSGTIFLQAEAIQDCRRICDAIFDLAEGSQNPSDETNQRSNLGRIEHL